MPRIDDATREQRRERVWFKVRSSPNGIREVEIADELRMGRRTVNNYLRDLEIEGRIIKDGRLWYPAPWQETRLRPFELTPEEALTLYLGARLLAKQHDKRNEPAETALLKLAQALRDGARVGREIEQAAEELAQRPVREGYQPIFRDVVRAYIYRKKIRLRYKPLNWKKSFETLFSTYLIEPSLIGSAIYIIGHSSAPNALRAYKIGRIQSAELTREDYAVPDDFPGLAILRNAWNIITGEETVRVVLRFSPRVRERVKETVWHPSEKKSEDPEKAGWLRWTAEIANTQDIRPWIRSWGADCEVLEPERVRNTLQNEVNRMARVYKVNMRPPLYALWAKTDRTGERMHPLLYHAIDVGEVARLLWEHGLTPGIRTQVAADLEVETAEAGALFTFLASLHDIGKASPAYQTRYPPYDQALDDLHILGFDLPTPPVAYPVPHGIVSAYALSSLLRNIHDDAYVTRRLAHAVGGHHGLWPHTLQVQELEDKYRSQAGRGLWKTIRERLFEALCELYRPPSGFVFPEDTAVQNRLLALLSGFVTAADWLGSMQEYFDYEEAILSPETYRRRAAKKARRTLDETGWLDTWQPKGEPQPFEKIFPFAPNEIQQAVIEHARAAEQPALLILEAPTGIGKTEAAFYLADTWLQAHQGRGLYVAMPTQATSNQMFTRTLEFLQTRYPDQAVNVHLAHGQARWHEDMERLRLNAIGDEAEDGLRAATWFTPRKRTLLAPFAVGTVDQALMGVLQTRHFFLRLFGLAHKVVIFDEVHAYDTYMEELFLRLLAWLRAIGASVIVLSATLPRETRRKMAAAWGRSLPADGQTPYPRLTLVTPQSAASQPLPQPPDRTIRLETLEQAPAVIADLLAERLQAGGCAAVICNTVRRAQEVYRALATHFPPEERILFHARTPFKWRQETEEQVLAWFSKKGKRPRRAVVVATQVIEQSLDLDFDLMVSDLAPMDLLIQRAGRLHRHDRATRPAGLKAPTLYLALPEGTLEKPVFDAHAFIYEPYLLWQTWRALENRSSLRLPSETDALIQAVYRPFDPAATPEALRPGLKKAWEDLQEDFRESAYKAGESLVASPEATDRLVTKPYKNLRDDEDPALHPSARARTRLIPPGVQIVCLHRQPDGRLTLEPDGRGKAIPNPENTPPSHEQTKNVLKYTLTVHDARLVQRLAGEPSPWRRQSALRFVYLLVFENGRCDLDGLALAIDRTFGFRILSAKEAA